MSHYRNRVLRHSAKAILNSTKSLSSVTLGKHFIGKWFFVKYFFSDTRQRLCRVSKNIWQIKIAKNPKNSKTFF
jgi:hypothetical protein